MLGALGGLAVDLRPRHRRPPAKKFEICSLLDFSVRGGHDETSAFQRAEAAFGPDKTGTVEVPPPPRGDAYYIKNFRHKNSNVTFKALGNRLPIKYAGTGTEAGSIIIADKDTDHAGENFRGISWQGFSFDGMALALHSANMYGITRDSGFIDCEFWNSVNPLKLVDTYYMFVKGCEVHFTTRTAPAGMAGATFNANLFGLYMHTCHVMYFEQFKMNHVGGNGSNQYTAAIRMTSAKSVVFDDYALELMQRTAHTRYIAKLIDIQGGCNPIFNGGYIEEVQAGDTLLKTNEHSNSTWNSPYFNGVIAPSLWEVEQHTPVAVHAPEGENLDLSYGILKVVGGSQRSYAVSLTGKASMSFGQQSGLVYDGSTTTNSKYGSPSDAIIGANGKATVVTGWVQRGYTATINGNNIEVTNGEAVINGNVVGYGLNSSLSQRFSPTLDLGSVDTWYLKVGAFGHPYCELADTSLVGSGDSLTIYSFVTDGDGSAPHTLTAVKPEATRVVGGTRYLPTGSLFRINQEGEFEASLADNTAKTICRMSLSSNTTEDDFLTVTMKDCVVKTETGSTSSGERGEVTICFGRDDGGNYVVTGIGEDGVVQSIDATMVSLGVTWTVVRTDHHLDIKVTADANADSASIITGTAHCRGGTRAGDAFSLDSGVTRLA